MAERPVASVEHRREAVVLRILSEEVRKEEVDEICGQVDEALKVAPALPFVLDMSRIRFLPSLAMGALMGLNQEFRRRGQRLIFAALQPNVRQSLSISRLNRI